MRRALRIVGIVLAVFIALSLSSCKPGEDASIFGTWFLDTFIFGTETITFTTTTFNRTTSIVFSGTQSGTVDFYDEDAGHIRTTVTAATGTLAPTMGQQIYWSYTISGNEMEQSNDPSSYPSDPPDNGPYELQ